VPDSKVLSPQTIAAIGERLRAARTRKSRSSGLGAKLALAVALLVVVNAAFASAEWEHLWKWATSSLVDTVTQKPRPKPSIQRTPLDSAESLPSLGTATVDPSFSVPSLVSPEMAVPAAHLRPKPNVQSTRKGEDGREELTLFSRARATRDPTTCLGLLDEYQQRFPRGVFREEAELIRLDALLRAGQSADALRLLDRWQRGELTDLARPRELSVLRLELMAAAGRCADALAGDADTRGDSALDERWLYLRGVCHGRTGAISTARQDFEEYLRKYPEGRFASEVRKAIGQ
jgi:hypothetical protein